MKRKKLKAKYISYKVRETKAITLIALVITIIILIILAGITINLMLGKNGIFNKAKEAKEKTQYAHALEIINLKILDANTEKLSLDKRVCNIDELAEYMGKSEEIQVTIVKYYEIATVSNSLIKPERISGFLVKAVAYPKYTFKIGELCNIESVSTDEGNTLIPIDEFNISIGEPEVSLTISSFEELLNKNGITETYTKEDVANNKDGVLNVILGNQNSIEYIFNNPEEYIDILTNSQEAMTLLGKNKDIREKVINSELWCEKIANSEYRANFSEYIVYNAGTLIGTAGGRQYYKRYNGNALAAGFIRNGAEFMIVSKNKEAMLGYCTRDPSFDQDANGYVQQLEYENDIWYYAVIPYGWGNAQPISSTENSKYIGNFYDANASTYKQTYEPVAIYILNDYFRIV